MDTNQLSEWPWRPRGNTVTANYVRRLANKAEEEFRWCWSVLAELKYEFPPPGPLSKLVTFQPRLAKTLFALEHCYNQLKRQDRNTIKKKATLSRSDVASRLQRTRQLRAVINHCIDVGKVLGDSFAWLFYQREHRLLADHYRHPSVTRVATGVGGIGEITFLENLPVVNKYFVIYHGTTTFLRLGDISMVDTEKLKVVAIGELKSHRMVPTEISITVNLVGKKLQEDLVPVSPKSNMPNKSPAPAAKLDRKQQDRLRRQVKAIGMAFKSPQHPQLESDGNTTIDWNIEKLSELGRRSTTARFTCVKADRGLLLVGLKFRKSTLWATFTRGGKVDAMSKLDGVEHPARELVDRTLPDNSVTIGWLLHPAKGRYSLIVGMRPVVWWPLPRQILEDLIFRRLIVMTLFNPAFLIKELRDQGFSITCERGTELTISKPFRGASLAFGGFDYFLTLIQRYLLPQAMVVRMVQNCLSTLESKQFPMPAVVNLEYHFLFP